MRDNQLSRRKVLGALATTGGAGALVGTGTGALFSDEEPFTNNGIRASTSVAGVVDIEVDPNVISDGTGVIYEITLPEGVNNNPSYIWFRTGCPDPLELGCATEIEIREQCDGTGTTDIATGSARDALNALREGTRLCSGGDTCLQPGETQTLEIEVLGVEDGYNGPDGPLEFDIEFYGEQCRYDTGAEYPFDEPLEGECGSCDGFEDECESCDGSDAKGISFIAFGAKDADKEPDATVTAVNARNEDDEPTQAEWEVTNNVSVDYVIAKSGPYYTIYNYSDGAGTTSGTVETGDDPDADYYGEPSFTCPSKNNNGNGNGNNNGDGGVADCPCALADAKVGDGKGFGGTSTKLEGEEIEP